MLKSFKHTALMSSTIAFTVCFAVWTLLSIIGIKIKQELGLNEIQFSVLIAMPVLSGSVSRIFLGVLTDRFGGRKIFFYVMLFAALGIYLLTFEIGYYTLLTAALLLGLAGGSFAVGIAYVSAWYPKAQQGTALGIFGMGNAGSALTSLVAPLLLVYYDWFMVAKIYAIAMIVVAVLFYVITTEDPKTQSHKQNQTYDSRLMSQLAPLKYLQIWRFALYYFFVFGAYVALALWLPAYYVGVYGVSLPVAGALTSLYALPGGVFRALGGWLSDRFGARSIMYWTFIICLICTFILSYPATTYIVQGVKGDISFTFSIGLVPFVILTIILGFFMSLGKAAIYKHIPVYYPDHVGVVGGMVGMIGGLGGFALPIIFGILNAVMGVWTSCFMFLTIIVGIALIWMHLTIVYSLKRKYPEIRGDKHLPELTK